MVIIQIQMKPSIRPPSAKVGAVASSKVPGGTGVSALLKPNILSKHPDAKQPIKPETKSSLQKVASSSQLKPKIGSTSNLPTKPSSNLGSNHPLNPELKQKPPTNNKPSSGMKSITTSIHKSQNLPHNSEKPQPLLHPHSRVLKQQFPIKKAQGPTSRFQQAVQQDLVPCKDCGRSFVQKALARHEAICKKVFCQKRKPFNSAKQRLVSKQQIVLKKKTATKAQQSEQPLKSNAPQWKIESQSLRAAMKQARGQVLSPTEIKQAQSASSSQLSQCKFCSRKFAEQPFKRHVQFCEKKSREQGLANRRK